MSFAACQESGHGPGHDNPLQLQFDPDGPVAITAWQSNRRNASSVRWWRLATPTSGTVTPATAISKVGARHNLRPSNWDLVEINEAYAATPLVSTLVLADGDRTAAAEIRGRTNIHGGAVAIGHPLGASGARITMTLINGLRKRGGGRGVAAICGGFGQGDVIMVEVD